MNKTDKHYLEPWEFGENPTGTFSNEIVVRPAGEFPHGEWIADCGPNMPERVANARRIVATVNACVGLSTMALEKGALAQTLTAIRELIRSDLIHPDGCEICLATATIEGGKMVVHHEDSCKVGRLQTLLDSLGD